MERTCSKCGGVKAIELFVVDGARRRHVCKVCRSAQNAEYSRVRRRVRSQKDYDRRADEYKQMDAETRKLMREVEAERVRAREANLAVVREAYRRYFEFHFGARNG